MRPPMRLDEAHDDVGATLLAAPALVEHGAGLPDPGAGPEVEAKPACWCDRGGVLFAPRDTLRVSPGTARWVLGVARHGSTVGRRGGTGSVVDAVLTVRDRTLRFC